MKDKSGRTIKFAAALVLLIGITFFTWAKRGELFTSKATVKKSSLITVEDEKLVYDPQLLKELKNICSTIDGKGKKYYIAGMISSINEADTAETIKNAEYVFSKNANEFYYKLGNTETINAEGLYLFIDHTAKKVILSPEKKVVTNQELIDVKKLTDNLESEKYALTSFTKGSKRTITLLNEYHISCKQYSITFDTLSRQVQRVYCRLSNMEDPLRKDNEQIIDIRISETSKKANIEKFLAEEIVVKAGKEFKLSNKYQKYELLYTE